MRSLGTLHPTENPAPSDAIMSIVLAAATGQAFDMPAGSGYVNFAGNVDYWVRFGSTAAAIPGASSTAASSAAAVFKPTIRNFGSTASCTGFSIIAATSGAVTAEFYAKA